MSAAFVPAPQRAGKPGVTPETIQKMLDENSHLIKCVVENQQKGRIQVQNNFKIILTSTFSLFLFLLVAGMCRIPASFASQSGLACNCC